MKKSDFVVEVAKRAGIPRTKADEVVNHVLDIVSDTLKQGEKLTLTGFGTFEVRARAARPGINIRTKEKITIPASKRPVFNAGAVLKAAVSDHKKDAPVAKPAAKPAPKAAAKPAAKGKK